MDKKYRGKYKIEDDDILSGVESVEEVSHLDPIQSKIEMIKASKLPEWQKAAYIREITPKPEEDRLVSFSVYVRLRNISADISEAMKSFPAAKGVEKATLEQWDEVYKQF